MFSLILIRQIVLLSVELITQRELIIGYIFSLQLRPYFVSRCTSGDGTGMETNLCGDGWGWNGSSVGMEVKLDGDGWECI